MLHYHGNNEWLPAVLVVLFTDSMWQYNGQKPFYTAFTD